MEWVERVRSVRLKEYGTQHKYFYYDGWLRKNAEGQQYIEFTMNLSPSELVYYLETHETHESVQKLNLDEGVLKIFTLDGQRTIPLGSRLSYNLGELEVLDEQDEMSTLTLLVPQILEVLQTIQRGQVKWVPPEADPGYIEALH